MVGKENFWTDIIDQPLANSAENVESIMQGQCEDVKAASRGLIEARFVKLAFTTKTTGSMWSTQEMKLQFGSPKTIKVEKTALKTEKCPGGHIKCPGAHASLPGRAQ